MSEHAQLSPSSAYRWLKCGYSIHGEELPAGSFRYAEEGTRAHELAELFLRGTLRDQDIIRLCINAFGSQDLEMVTYVKQYIDAIQNFKYDIWFIEKKVLLNSQVWGTSDFIGENKDLIHVFDLKYGKTQVEAYNNPQLMIYGVAAWKTLGRPDKNVMLHICQPRAGCKYSNMLMTPADLVRFNAKVTVRARKIKDDKKKNPGEHCKYCRIKCEYNER